MQGQRKKTAKGTVPSSEGSGKGVPGPEIRQKPGGHVA